MESRIWSSTVEAEEPAVEAEDSVWRGGIADREVVGDAVVVEVGGEKRDGIANGDKECAAETAGLPFHLSKPGGDRADVDDEKAVADAAGLTAVLT